QHSGLDTVKLYVDSDDDNFQDASEPQATATKRWLATQPTVALAPPSMENQVNQPHKLTATVLDGTTPVPDVQVLFTATSPAAGALVLRRDEVFRSYAVRHCASGH